MNTNNQYLKVYRNAKKAWKDEFDKHHGTTHKFCKEHQIQGLKRKRPWFLLSKRDSSVIESRVKGKKINRTELMEGYVQHKLKKWEKKNPCPVEKDDLFYSQEFPVWDNKRQNAEEYLRNVVINKYTNKLSLIGRFEVSDNKYVEREIAKIPDKYGEVVRAKGAGYLSSKTVIMRKAQTITNTIRKTNPKCVCTNLLDRKANRGRILLPKMELAA